MRPGPVSPDPRAPADRAGLPPDPYRALPSGRGGPGAFPAPGEPAPAPTWPEALTGGAADAPPPKRALVVSRPERDLVWSAVLADAMMSSVLPGDAAGEHRFLRRGPHRAWFHVDVAFVAEVALFGCVPGWFAGELLHLSTSGPSVLLGVLVFGLLGGLPPAWLVYRDRWLCIEAYASSFCVDLPLISALYVPLIAFVYANVRGVMKVFNR
jgi:hypothetical protein